MTQLLPLRQATTARKSEDPPDELRRLHVNEGVCFRNHFLTSFAFVSLCVAALLAWQQGWWGVTLLCWLAAGHLGHNKALAMHEAAHGMLDTKLWRNELQGIQLCLYMLMPFSMYRFVHSWHHAYVATEKDLELWPYVDPRMPRWFRILAAIGELTCGFLVQPLIFHRGVLMHWQSVPKRLRPRMLAGYALVIGFWSLVLCVVAWFGWWAEFAVLYIVPAWLAGNFRTWGKFTEHVGLMEDTVLGSSRTVVDPRLVGQFYSRSLLHVDHHGTHHRYAKVPFYHLPEATRLVYAREDAALPVFPNYPSAVWDMLRTLGNPRVGAQWRDRHSRG